MCINGLRCISKGGEKRWQEEAADKVVDKDKPVVVEEDSREAVEWVQLASVSAPSVDTKPNIKGESLATKLIVPSAVRRW
ncbi:MAG: hypothetical protein R6U61_01875 [Thermoplasmata archaeon]